MKDGVLKTEIVGWGDISRMACEALENSGFSGLLDTHTETNNYPKYAGCNWAVLVSYLLFKAEDRSRSKYHSHLNKGIQVKQPCCFFGVQIGPVLKEDMHK